MIETRNLCKNHGSLQVLGGGKSTFLRCLNGLETFHDGEVRVGDHTLLPGEQHGSSRAALLGVRRQLGMVFQQFNLFPHLSVLGNIVEAPMRVLGLEREAAVERAMALLERVGLKEKADAMPAQLSGGQQQRVAIARALAMQPKAMLFDEPTSALDPRMTAEVLDVMTDLARDGQTMVVVTHAMHFARRVAHRVHVFHDGQVAESGQAEQVFDSPRSEVTREFLRGMS